MKIVSLLIYDAGRLALKRVRQNLCPICNHKINNYENDKGLEINQVGCNNCKAIYELIIMDNKEIL